MRHGAYHWRSELDDSCGRKPSNQSRRVLVARVVTLGDPSQSRASCEGALQDAGASRPLTTRSRNPGRIAGIVMAVRFQ